MSSGQLSRWQTFVNGTDAWTTVFLENHDQGRSISRFGSDSEYYREHDRDIIHLLGPGDRDDECAEELGRGGV
jgi:glycosidase